MPISAGVSSRATTTVCPSEMSWVNTSAIAANWAPRRSRPPRPSSDGLCSSGSFTSGVAPPSDSGSDVASGIASAMSGSACSRERWSREPGSREPGSRSGPRSGWPSLSGGCVMDLSSPSGPRDRTIPRRRARHGRGTPSYRGREDAPGSRGVPPRRWRGHRRPSPAGPRCRSTARGPCRRHRSRSPGRRRRPVAPAARRVATITGPASGATCAPTNQHGRRASRRSDHQPSSPAPSSPPYRRQPVSGAVAAVTIRRTGWPSRRATTVPCRRRCRRRPRGPDAEARWCGWDTPRRHHR